MKARSFKNTVFAFSLFAGWLMPAAHGDTITYDGSNPNLLKTDPFPYSDPALYPGTTSLSNNTVNVTGGHISGYVYGGALYSQELADQTISNNTVTISGGTIMGAVYGARLAPVHATNFQDATMTVENNKVIVTAGTINRNVIGGIVDARQQGTAISTGNSVEISGGTINAEIFGGYAMGGRYGKTGQATGNTVKISGGTISQNIYGGYSDIDINFYREEQGIATGNTVEISGRVDLSQSLIYGGLVGAYWKNPHVNWPGMDARTGNTLHLSSTGITVKGIANFQHYNFAVTDTILDGSPMLTISGQELTLLAGDTGTIDFSQYNGDIGAGESIDIMVAAAGLTDGSTDTIDWIITGYHGTLLAGRELSAFWKGNTLQVGWTSAIPEPATYGVLCGLVVIGGTLIRRRSNRN